MAGVEPFDLFVVALYFVTITLFGASFGRFTRSAKDFFLAGQRFPGWLLAFSCVATVVGSYSFVKYASAGYRFGLSSSQTYLNDWFWMPLFLFGWFPILYAARVLSVPEYFRRRFDAPTGLAATLVLILYLVGYIGINLYTLGTALGGLFGIDVFWMAVIVAALCMVYELTGGQTSVILTDFFQGALLLVVGLALFLFGIAGLGGFGGFYEGLPAAHRLPLPAFNTPSGFNFVGIFWQDGLAGGVAFYFMNQGMLLRFLSARSVRHGRRAGAIVLLVLMPLAAISVSGLGWIGASMTGRGMLPADSAPDQIFVTVARMLTVPGIFGLVMAALLAALMSTVDTLINATSALLVNDVWKPWIAKDAAPDPKRDLRLARWTSLMAAAAGLALVPVYRSFGTIYEAHGAFTAAITPPMVVALLLAFLWPGFTPRAALTTLVVGTGLMFASTAIPGLVAPFDHGVSPDGGYKYIRACYGVVVSLILGVAVSRFTVPAPADRLKGLTLWTVERRERARFPRKRRLKLALRASSGAGPAILGARDAESLGIESGDEIFVDDRRAWLGGLRSLRTDVQVVEQSEGIALPGERIREQGWKDGDTVVLETLG